MSAQSVEVVNLFSVNRSASFATGTGMRRWSRVLASLCVGVAALAATAAPAAAQWRVGAFLGGEHESSWDEFLVIGADARGTVGAHSFEINPRASYFIRSDLKRFQIDLNVLKSLPLADYPRIVPYIGTGVAVESVDYKNEEAQDQSKIGFNYVMGATFIPLSRLQPFAQFQYTVLHDSANNAVISAGVHFKLGSSTR